MKKTKKRLKAELVFHLIKKMSQANKRHFKINNQTYKGDKDFLKLYDFLNVQDEFNLPKLGIFFKKEKITNTSVCITYLHDKIIGTLQEDARKSLRNKIHIYNENIEHHLNCCNVYLYADLPENALKEIHKAEEIALKFEDYHYLVRIYFIHRNVLKMTHLNHDMYEELREDVMDKLEWALQQLSLINKILNDKRKALFNTDLDAPVYQETFRKIQEYTTRMDELPHVCQQAILSVKVQHHYMKREYPEIVDLLEQMIASWNEIPYERWDLTGYLEQWANLLVINVDSNMPHSKFDEYYKKYSELPAKHPDLFDTQTFRGLYFVIKYNVDTLTLIRHENYKKVDTLEKEMLEVLPDFSKLPMLTIIIHMIFLRIALGHLMLKNYDKTDYWISQCQEPDTISDVWSNTREILNVMIHYEQENYTYLKSKIRNLKRQWKKEEMESPNALVLLRLIQKVLLKSNKNKIPEIWQSGLEAMYEAEKSRNFYFIKLSKWVKAKISS